MRNNASSAAGSAAQPACHGRGSWVSKAVNRRRWLPAGASFATWLWLAGGLGIAQLPLAGEARAELGAAGAAARTVKGRTDPRPEPGIVLGDSIGQDLALTVGLKTIAKTSFSLRRHDISTQLAQVPGNSIVLLSLGINDGAAPVANIAPFIERVIAAIKASGHRVVWMGPPCVLKKWDKAAEKIDQHLRQRLAATAIQYVSLRDEIICDKRLRTRDGEHFTPKGYHYLWRKIRADSSLAARIAVK